MWIMEWDEPGEPAEMLLPNPHYQIYYRTIEELGYLYGDKISLKWSAGGNYSQISAAFWALSI